LATYIQTAPYTYRSSTLTAKPVGASAPSLFLRAPMMTVMMQMKTRNNRIQLLKWSEIIMAALRSGCGHYIFVLWFLLLSFFLFPRLISAVADWMSTILHTWCGLSANLECRCGMYCTRLAEKTGRKKSPKICHLRTIVQLCRVISS